MSLGWDESHDVSESGGARTEELSQTWTRQLKALQAFPLHLTSSFSPRVCNLHGAAALAICPHPIALLFSHAFQTAASAATFFFLECSQLVPPWQALLSPLMSVVSAPA